MRRLRTSTEEKEVFQGRALDMVAVESFRQGSDANCDSIDFVTPMEPPTHRRAHFFVFEDTEAVIEVRSPPMRHVSCTRRVDLDSLWERVTVDSHVHSSWWSQIRTLLTCCQLVLSHETNGTSPCAFFKHLLAQTAPESHPQLPQRSWQDPFRKEKRTEVVSCWKPSPSRVEDFSQFLKHTGPDGPQRPTCHGESINVERCYQISIPTVNGNVEKSHKCTLQTVIKHDKFERRRGVLREKHGTNLAMPILRSTPEKAAARKKREMRVPCVAGPSGVVPALPHWTRR